jgi:regulator of cell morphogenesis and NO signaling
MPPISPQHTLADVVTADPSLARQLERHGLDYCCGGTRTVAEACAGRGIDVDDLIAELTTDTEAPSPDWATMAADELVDHIESTHHRYLWRELPRLGALVDKEKSVHGARHPELDDIARCYDDLRADLEPHLLKEERVLFPMIRQLAAAHARPAFHCGTLRNPISVMEREHDTAGALLAQLRESTSGYTPPADGCATYEMLYRGLADLEADTHLHVHKENNILFPMVERIERRLDRE